MTCTFPATLSRPVAHDCDDTFSVPVDVACDAFRDGEVDFLDAVVSADVRADDQTLAYHQGETIRHQSYTSANIAELNAAYLKTHRRHEPDNVQEFPCYDADPLPADDYDQRVHRRAT